MATLRPDISVVDYLISVGKGGTWQDQVEAANHYGIQNYTGSYSQNADLLSRMHADKYGTTGSVDVNASNPSTSVDASAGENKTESSTQSVVQPPSYEQNKPTYTQGDKALSSLQQLQQIQNSKPGAYESQYQKQIDALLNDVLNRDPFSYDVNTDPLYQQYREQYITQGNRAARDVTANAAALTGGYGSSYASTAGSQAYDTYLNQLNDRVPELYQLAYQRYLNEEASKKDKLSILQGLEDADYGRYRDSYGDWETNRDYYTDLYNYENNMDYQKYLDALSAWQADRAYGYQKDYDAQQQSNWQTEFDYQKYLDGLSLGNSYGSGGGYSGGTGTKTSTSSGSGNTNSTSASEYNLGNTINALDLTNPGNFNPSSDTGQKILSALGNVLPDAAKQDLANGILGATGQTNQQKADALNALGVKPSQVTGKTTSTNSTKKKEADWWKENDVSLW